MERSKFTAMKALIATALASAYNGVRTRPNIQHALPDHVRYPGLFDSWLFDSRATQYPPPGWQQTPEQKDRALTSAGAKRAQRRARNLLLFRRGAIGGA